MAAFCGRALVAGVDPARVDGLPTWQLRSAQARLEQVASVAASVFCHVWLGQAVAGQRRLGRTEGLRPAFAGAVVLVLQRSQQNLSRAVAYLRSQVARAPRALGVRDAAP